MLAQALWLLRAFYINLGILQTHADLVSLQVTSKLIAREIALPHGGRSGRLAGHSGPQTIPSRRRIVQRVPAGSQQQAAAAACGARQRLPAAAARPVASRQRSSR